jgi:hypothetical protein
VRGRGGKITIAIDRRGGVGLDRHPLVGGFSLLIFDPSKGRSLLGAQDVYFFSLMCINISSNIMRLWGKERNIV